MKTVALVMALTLPLVACGGADAATVDGPADGVVLTVTHEGGFAPVDRLVGRLPRYVLLADGTLFTPAPVAAIHPGPLVAPVTVGQIDSARLQAILDLVGRTGLADTDRIDDPGPGNVADALTTVITFTDAGGDHAMTVYALGIGSSPSTTARSATELLTILDGAAATFHPVGDYTPDRVEVWTGDRMAAPDPAFRTIRPWPLDVAPDDMPEIRPGWRCTVIEGSTLDDVFGMFLDADRATVWDDGGELHPLVVRMLLPGESGCA